MTVETNRAAILERISAIILEVLPRTGTLALSDATTANEVPGWDSLTHVKIIVRVERAFKIRIRTTEMAKLDNIGSLIDVIVARAGAGT